MTSDMEKAISLILRSPTPTIADNVYAMVLEYVRTFSSNGKIRLFWTHSANDWPDVINGPLRELTFALGAYQVNLQVIYGLLLQLRLISDTLAEERKNGKESSPGSLHATIVDKFESQEWSYFVTRAFKVLSPKVDPRSKETKTEHASRKKRRRKSPVKPSPSTAIPITSMDVSDPSTSTPSTQTEGQSTVDESWMQKRLVLESHVYAVRMTMLEVLENIFVILYPRQANILDEVVSGFADLPTDALRLFFLNKFMASPQSRLALLDVLLMQHFERNSSSVARKTYTVTSGGVGVDKMLTVYWDLRPIRMPSRPEDGVAPKSNYIILSTLLLHMLDALNFPSAFSASGLDTCVEKARLLYNETKILPSQETIFTEEEIDNAIEAARDLYEFVTNMVDTK